MTEDDDTIISDIFATCDEVMDGAALQSAHEDPDMDGVPKVIRYAILAATEQIGTARRLASEIIEVVPELSDQTNAWISNRTLQHSLDLAIALDTLSVEKDRTVLRSLADCIRIVSLPVPSSKYPCAHAYMRVGRVLNLSREMLEGQPDDLRSKAERAVLAWAVAPILCSQRMRTNGASAIVAGGRIVDEMIEAKVRTSLQKVAQVEAPSNGSNAQGQLPLSGVDCPPGHVIVCHRRIEGSLMSRANEVLRPHAHAINAPIPLVACPDLRIVRSALLQEFPYAAEVIDFALAGLVGRPTVVFEPLMLVGVPGGGKSRFARRLCELLSVGLWRVDATQADGSACAGTDKRWSTASPSAPFLAISRFQQANPVLLIDEVDKAATRSDYGRLWDVMISLCERENTRSYPDPGLGVEVDISHVSYVATANSTAVLPAPLVDRFRQVEFPSPRIEDLDDLVDSLRREIAQERRIDAGFFLPLSAMERHLLLRNWGGGSVRRLRRMLDVVYRARDRQSVFQ